MTTPPGPAALSPPLWPHCGDGATPTDPAGCRGRRVEPYPQCLAHLASADRAAYLAALASGADIDHRGTTLTPADLTDLLDAVRGPASGPSLGAAHFDDATFTADAGFGSAVFSDRAEFRGAVFSGVADFSGAVFAGRSFFSDAAFSRVADFSGAVFAGRSYFSDAAFSGKADFGSAAFSGRAEFRGAAFADVGWFYVARFAGSAGFYDAAFSADAEFSDAVFSGKAEFGGATFSNDAGFARVRFAGRAGFDDAAFSGRAEFSGAEFAGDTEFNGAAFSGDTDFSGAVFSGDAGFDATAFAGDADLSGVVFSSHALFRGATFARAGSLGPLVCGGEVTLSGAVFGAAVIIEAAANRVACRRTRWEHTATLRLRYAELDLTDAVFTQPLAVTTHPEPFPGLGSADALLLGGNPETVAVTSLRGVDAAFLALTDTDLTRCRLAGAFHLDQIRLHGRIEFAMPPVGTRRRYGVPLRWTRRRTLAEEHHWRAIAPPPANAVAPAPADWTPGPDHPNPRLTPGPDDIAPLYRALRKSFEDGKNEPGAADFYMGEMEMRRHDRVDTGPAERAILTVYWALSGYGLRASRALAWLGGAMTATVLALMLWGLPAADPKPVTAGAQVAVGQQVRLVTDTPEAALSTAYGDRITAQRAEKAGRVVLNSVVFRSSGQNLTIPGTYIEMASRFLEPVLLALAALAVRGRVKR